ncbi:MULTISPECIES: Rv1733c family protein [Rhodococcus]|uniref:Transmembrane protein n=1 Tax=Rhodococcus globerulus TaxID=33008 RepID=A0ABU4BU15_RHOGO|nr:MULTISPECIES: hypothetical protein [Rhodococcus]MDV6267718.1 hypothetical protein [Rhodococcus globerulus]MDV8065711.1 hypothetical protein [Rhodococcus sp. IEGM 1366]
MSASTRATASLLRRTIHVGHDPMVRRSDRIEGFMSFGLIVLAILLVPFAIWAGGATAASQNALIADQARSTHSIAAVTTGDSVTSSVATADYIPANTETAPAQWNWNGQVHREDITVDETTPAGTSVDIYVDNNGDKTIAPITQSAADVAAVVTGIFTWFSIMSLLTIGFMLIRVWLDRSRDAQWDRDLRAFLDAHG